MLIEIRFDYFYDFRDASVQIIYGERTYSKPNIFVTSSGNKLKSKKKIAIRYDFIVR